MVQKIKGKVIYNYDNKGIMLVDTELSTGPANPWL